MFVDVILNFEKFAYPRKFRVHFGRSTFARFVFPVRRDTHFGYTVHFFRSYLYFENMSLVGNGRMQGLIHIRFRRCDIVFKSARNGAEYIVHIAERIVTVIHLFNNDTERVKVIYLVKLLVLIEHLAVYAVNVLYTSRYTGFYADLGKFIRDYAANLVQNIAVCIERFQVRHYLIVTHGVKVFE